MAATCPGCGAPLGRDWIDVFLSVGGFGRATGPEQKQRQSQMKAQLQRLPFRERSDLIGKAGKRAKEQAERTRQAQRASAGSAHPAPMKQGVSTWGKVVIGMLGGALLLLSISFLERGRPPQPSTTPTPAPVVVSKPTAAVTARPAHPTVGDTVSLGGWRVSFRDFGVPEKMIMRPNNLPRGQGALVIARLDVTNLQNSTSNFTINDFAIRSSDGREFKPADQTVIIEDGFVISKTVQPGLSASANIVFDIDPSARNLMLTVLKTQFAVPWSDQDQAARSTAVRQTLEAVRTELDDRGTRTTNIGATGTVIEATSQAIRASSTAGSASYRATVDPMMTSISATTQAITTPQVQTKPR